LIEDCRARTGNGQRFSAPGSTSPTGKVAGEVQRACAVIGDGIGLRRRIGS
jgi:hypothetical protein